MVLVFLQTPAKLMPTWQINLGRYRHWLSNSSISYLRVRGFLRIICLLMKFRGYRERFRGGDDDNVIHAAERFRLGQLMELDAETPARPYDWETTSEYASEYPLGQTAVLSLVEPLPANNPQPPAAV